MTVSDNLHLFSEKEARSLAVREVVRWRRREKNVVNSVADLVAI